ncbi:MAG: hypothetical protein CVT59_05940 [Actinobacteria bacterium HGW-Actinobacteria-1]|jgi:hypothetical protein|nr:MAG: hypothetical protein CVT59_05940 [Actinobacteria bacterium HGW-Actinobacteria-1]
MAVGLRRRRRRAKVARVALALGVLVLVAVGVRLAQGYAGRAAFDRRIAALEQSADPERALKAQMVFDFAGRTYLISVPVDLDRVERERTLDTSVVFESTGTDRERYLRTVVDELSHSRLIGRLTDEFRLIKLEQRLDSDQYLELLARAVQQIPYGDVRRDFRLPSEVLIARTAVCSEKTVLLAALLQHEGYDTAVWVLDSGGHAAVGVACSGQGYRGSGYAFVETTIVSFVGQVDPRYSARSHVATPPQLVRIAEGKTYRADGEVDVILSILDAASRQRRTLAPYVRYASTGGSLHATRYAERAHQYENADSLSAYILGNMSDRARVYRELTQSARDLILEGAAG